MKVRVFRVPDCDTRITRTKFGFCKLLPEIPKQNSGFGYFGFGFGYFGSGFRVTGFLPSPRLQYLFMSVSPFGVEKIWMAMGQIWIGYCKYPSVAISTVTDNIRPRLYPRVEIHIYVRAHRVSDIYRI
jgi:hypothetical protein